MPEMHDNITDLERLKVPPAKMLLESGPGIPMAFMPLINAGRAAGKWKVKSGLINVGGKNAPLAESMDIKAQQQLADDFPGFSTNLNLFQYDFNEDDEIDPAKLNVSLDVTALDRYNEDVRKYRRLVIEESRLIPHASIRVEMASLLRLTSAVQSLCRTAYYGTTKAQQLAEATVPIIIWILSRRHLPTLFYMRILQSVAEMTWTSFLLKKKFRNAYGVQVIQRLMKAGLVVCPELACWAGYTLAMCAIGSADVILEARNMDGFDETVGELAFDMYWYDWPANFGSILQGILWGPFSVNPLEEFQFL